MPQVINTNLASLQAQRALSSSQSDVNTSLQRLSSGLRINGAKDDAAGLAISERFNSQIKGLNQAARNANDATSLAQTAEGALSEVTSNLQRMRELAVQSSNATNSASDRTALQTEVTQLMAEIDRVSNQASFNGIKLLNGSFTAQAFQVGANAAETVSIDSIASSRTADLGTFNGVVITNTAFGTASNTAAAKTVTINGVATSIGSVADDAKAIANALNASGLGFVASANATTVTGTNTVAAGASGETSKYTINGIETAQLSSTTVAATDRQNATDAINAISARTGVTAVNDGAKINLTAADGRNITIAFTGASGAATADYGVTATAITGATMNITLKTSESNNVTIGGVGSPPGSSTIFDGNIAIGTVGAALSTRDVTTVANAQSMITAVDAALDSVNSSRASLGAIQNRFDSIVSALQTASENQSAARSRIVDADFAAETAALTRGQILQQAGIAVLAQANAAPQNVLALLQ